MVNFHLRKWYLPCNDGMEWRWVLISFFRTTHYLWRLRLNSHNEYRIQKSNWENGLQLRWITLKHNKCSIVSIKMLLTVTNEWMNVKTRTWKFNVNMCINSVSDIINILIEIVEPDLIPRLTRPYSPCTVTIILYIFLQQQTFRQWWTFTYENGIYVALMVWNGD